ncbi:MAG: hypothetical protein J0L73_27640 [Verrucomicrobia bacterium]|nr:hypothetical protein [Verrucomicrobiota bacterium]
MKTHALILAVAAALSATLSLSSCTNPAMLKINTPAVQAQIIGAVEKDILAGGGALLISGGSGSAAVAAMTAQELKNLPALQEALAPQATPKNPGAAVTP